LWAQGRSREETAEIVGVAPETISVWKRHPQWQLEVDRWRAFAEAPLDRQQLRLKLESAEATIEALEQLRLIMGSATKRVRTPIGVSEQPDWSTRLKACRLVLAVAVAVMPELGADAGQAPAARRPLRVVP
jgi:hypothetical protein